MSRENSTGCGGDGCGVLVNGGSGVLLTELRLVRVVRPTCSNDRSSAVANSRRARDCPPYLCARVFSGSFRLKNGCEFILRTLLTHSCAHFRVVFVRCFAEVSYMGNRYAMSGGIGTRSCIGDCNTVLRPASVRETNLVDKPRGILYGPVR